MNRRWTNGLAWAGVILVIGVPAADFLTSKRGDAPSATLVATAEPTVKTPALVAPIPATRPVAKQVAEVQPVTESKPVAPAKPATVASSGAVDGYLSSGKKLPSYITGADSAPVAAAPVKPVAPVAPVSAPAEVAAVPAPATVPTVVTPTTTPIQTIVTPTQAAGEPLQPAQYQSVDPVTVASIAPSVKVAPIPLPASARPAPSSREQLIIAEPTLPLGGQRPVRGRQPLVGFAPDVTVNDLRGWTSGTLSDFLADQQQPRQPVSRVPPRPLNGYGGETADERYLREYDDRYEEPESSYFVIN